MMRLSSTLTLFLLATASLFAQTNPVIGGPSTGFGTVAVNTTLLTPTVTGGTPGYTWTVIGTPLPAGLQILATDGRIYGAANSGTNSTGVVVRLQVADSQMPKRTATRDVTLIIRNTFNFGPLNGLPSAGAGTAYNQCLTAEGGSSDIASVSYFVLTGSLPDGIFLALNTCGLGNNSASLRGSPTRGGNFPFTIRATDSEGRIVDRSLSITVGATPTLIASPTASYDFFCTIGLNCDTPQQAIVTIQSSPANGVTPITVTSLTQQPAWLAFSCCDAVSTPTRVTITVNPNPNSTTSPGIYTATLQVAGPAGVTPISITIKLTAGVQNGVLSTPTELVFNYTTGNSAPSPQSIDLRNNGGADANYRLFANTQSGGNWIVLNSASVSTPGSFTTQVNPVGLTLGTYKGSIVVTNLANATVLTIPVTLNIVATNQLVLSTQSLNFSFVNGSGSPAPVQQVSVTSAGAPLALSVQFITISGGNWLNANPQFTNTPANLAVSLTNTIPGPGTYTGSITVGGAGVQSQTILVSLTVTGSPSLAVSPTSLNFNQTIGGGALPSQTLSLSSGSLNYTFTASTITTDGGNWLSVGQTAGSTPVNIQVSANTAGLAVGTYTGRVVIASNDSPNSPVNVPVTLVISQTGTIGASPTALTFQYQTGADLPAGQQLLVASAIPTTFTITPTSLGGWLRVTQTNGSTPSSITISVSPLGLVAGSYTGSLSIQSVTAGQISIPVTLTVTTPTSFASSPASLGFSHRLGSTLPPSQIIKISSGTATSRFNTSVRIATGNWLSVTPVEAFTPSDVTVSVDPTILPVGDYTASVLITPVDGSPALTIPVSLSVLNAAKPLVKSVTNAASFLSADAVPGMIFTIFGAGIGPDQTTGVQLVNGVISTTTGNTRVFFDEIPAPMIYAARDQVAGVVPYGIASRSVVQLAVETRGIRSDPFQLRVSSTSPGIFTSNTSGRGNAAALNQDGSVNSGVNPANPGSVVVLYLTGEGLVTPTPSDGQLTTLPLPRLVATVGVRFGLIPGTIEYAGPAPGLVAGLLQVNVRVPLGIAGDVPVSVSIGGNASQSGVTVAVRDAR